MSVAVLLAGLAWGCSDSGDGDETGIPEAGAPNQGSGGSDPGTGGSDPGTGGSDPGTGGSDPGTGGSDPGTGGSDPGTGGSNPGTGGSDPGTGGSDPGTGGSGTIPSGDTGVFFEVESVDPVDPWTFSTEKSDYSGSGYFAWPDVADNEHGITRNQDSAITWEFELGTEGTYLIEVRGRRDHEGWCTDAPNDACNDVYMKIDDGNWTKKMIKQGTWDDWVWDGKWEPGSHVTTTKVQLSPGVHTLGIAGRSNGVKIDAIRIYLEGTDPPTG